jgi:hypothetical protein
VGELSNHLSARTVLYEQCVFATDFRAPRDVGHFDKQRGITARDGRHTTIDCALFGVDLAWPKSHLVCVVISRFDDTAKNIRQLWLIVYETQQRFASCALHTNAKDVFGGWIKVDNEQAFVEKDDA